jgi:thiol-disulfide isomerase/thioredoxin
MRPRLAFLVGLLLEAVACAPASPPASPPIASEPLTIPNAPLVTLSGETTELAKVTRGRAALVSFWATWCEACKKEMVALNRLAARTGDSSDSIVIGIAVGEPRQTVDAFARQRGLRYLQLVDQDFSLTDALGQRSIPATLVVDREGRVVFRGEGLDEKGLEAFRNAMAGTPSAQP